MRSKKTTTKGPTLEASQSLTSAILRPETPPARGLVRMYRISRVYFPVCNECHDRFTAAAKADRRELDVGPITASFACSQCGRQNAISLAALGDPRIQSLMRQ